MTVSELSTGLGFTELALPDPNREIDGVYIGDLLSWVMGKASEGNAWITIMSNVNVIAVATLSDVACVIFAEGVKPDAELITLANTKGVNLLTAREPAYDIAVKLSGALK